MTTVIKQFRGEKTRGVRAIDGFRNKLMIPDSDIPEFPEFEVKSKIRKIFKNNNFLDEYSGRIYKTDPYFSEHYGKNIQVDKNGIKCKLFRTDVYFNEFLLAVGIDEEGHADRDFIFEEKTQKTLEKKLN